MPRDRYRTRTAGRRVRAARERAPCGRAARARAAHLALSRTAGARADAEALARRLRADPRISAVRFVPREEALKEMSAVQGLREVIAALGRNPLPDAFVITSNADIADELGRLPGGARAGGRRLGPAAGRGRPARAVRPCAARGASRRRARRCDLQHHPAQILTQRDEIEVSKLIGATDAFIRRPFYYLGLLQGLVGGGLALGLVAAALALLNREVGVLAESYGSVFASPSCPPRGGRGGPVRGLPRLARRPIVREPPSPGDRTDVANPGSNPEVGRLCVSAHLRCGA